MYQFEGLKIVIAQFKDFFEECRFLESSFPIREES